jgi:hypothetical protein
VILLY